MILVKLCKRLINSLSRKKPLVAAVPLSNTNSIRKENTYSLPLSIYFKNRDLDSCLLEASSLKGGFDIIRYSHNFFVSHKSNHIFAWHLSSGSQITGHATMSLCNNKNWTKTLLQQNNIAVPEGSIFNFWTKKHVYDYVNELGFPVVVKPTEGTKGKGVTVNIGTKRELKRTLRSMLFEKSIVVEKFIEGQDYRFFVIGDTVASVLVRQPAQIIGDGTHTIKELIMDVNYYRKMNPRLHNSLILVDSELKKNLKYRYKKTLHAIPKKGEAIVLRSAANISQGGTAKDITDEVHPSLIQYAVSVRKAIPGAEIAGIDLILDDHKRSLDEQSCVVLEVNYRPAIASHEFVSHGNPVPIADKVIKYSCSKTGLMENIILETIHGEFIISGFFNHGELKEFIKNLADEAHLVVNDFKQSHNCCSFSITDSPYIIAAVSTLIYSSNFTRKICSVEVKNLSE